MSVSVLIATYGGSEWEEMAWSRAHPSAITQCDDVSLFHDPDGTIASVRNELASTAKGEWLAFLDADDEFAPGYIDAMMRAAEREVDGDLLLTPAVQKIRKAGRAIPAPEFFEQRASLRDDNYIVVGTLIRRETFVAVGGFEDLPHGFEDFSLWSKAYRMGARVVKVPEAVYRYHWNPNSKHKQGWRNKKWQKATHLDVIAQLDQWEAAHR